MAVEKIGGELPSAALPEGGAPGQVLQRTEDGVTWEDVQAGSGGAVLSNAIVKADGFEFSPTPAAQTLANFGGSQEAEFGIAGEGAFAFQRLRLRLEGEGGVSTITAHIYAKDRATLLASSVPVNVPVGQAEHEFILAAEVAPTERFYVRLTYVGATFFWRGKNSGAGVISDSGHLTFLDNYRHGGTGTSEVRSNSAVLPFIAFLRAVVKNVTAPLDPVDLPGYEDAEPGQVLTRTAEGVEWEDGAGSTGGGAPLAGTSAQRPVNPLLGTSYYDTTLDRPIWWDGAGWRDAAGTVVLPPATEYRYYRLLISATNGAEDRTGVGELILREVAGGADVAQGKPVSSNSDPFGTAAQAVDGSTATDTGWIAGAESLPVWLQVDLGAATAVREYTVYGYGYTGAAATRSPRDWVLQGSNDALAWMDLHSAVAQGGWADFAGQQSRTFAV